MLRDYLFAKSLLIRPFHTHRHNPTLKLYFYLVIQVSFASKANIFCYKDYFPNTNNQVFLFDMFLNRSKGSHT